MTLHELATGVLPTWGDGATEPSQLSPQTEITIEPELFDASLREHLTSFFKKAFRRNINERFDNAEEMRRVWRNAFEGIEEPGKFSDHADESQLRQALARATFDTLVPELGLGTRATNALDRANVITVKDLLTVPIRRLRRLRGVGNKTRREIASAVRILRERLGSPSTSGTKDGPESEEAGLILGPIDPATFSIDLLTQRVLRVGIRDSDTTQRTAQALLGLDPAVPSPWPSQTEVAEALKVTRGRIGQIVAKLSVRWSKDPAITLVRSSVVEFLKASGGIQTVDELAEALLSSRGSSEDEPLRTQRARAVARATVEVERTMAEPRFLVRRDGHRVLIALDSELASYAGKLGNEADKLAGEDPLAAPSRALERLRQVFTSFPGPHRRHTARPACGGGLGECGRVKPARALSPRDAGSPDAQAFPGSLARCADSDGGSDPRAGGEPLSRSRAAARSAGARWAAPGCRVRVRLGRRRPGRSRVLCQPASKHDLGQQPQ